MTKKNDKEKEFGIIFLNDALKDIAKHIGYKNSVYWPLFVKLDHYGLDHSVQGFYARATNSGFSIENYLFKVQGKDFNDMILKFLDAYQKLYDLNYISHYAPYEWLHKSIKLEQKDLPQN